MLGLLLGGRWPQAFRAFRAIDPSRVHAGQRATSTPDEKRLLESLPIVRCRGW